MINAMLYELKRKKFIKELTSNLGRVVEEEDRLICYVNKRKLKKEQGKYYLRCWGTKRLKKYYDLDKTIIYIIDGIDFKFNWVYIFGDKDSTIMVKNCSFDLDLYINTEGVCILDNIYSVNSYFSHIYAKELIIKDSRMKNRKITNNSYIFGISALEKLEINNSIIGDKSTGTYIDSSNKLKINSSEISASNLGIKAKQMIVDKKSKIVATEKIDLEVPDFYDLTLKSPIINCNGTTYTNLKNPVVIKNRVNGERRKEIEPLQSKRLELINLLRNIKSNVIATNEETLEKYKDDLNRKPIIKALSK